MPGITINLSLLSRGVGTRRKNGHERIDVELEPQDYHNYHSARLYLPPVSEDSIATSSSRSEVPLPKTFTTRKGALILFSEDLAGKNKKKEDDSASLEEILHTVEDLGKAILSYGGKDSQVNLKFTNADKYKKFRPGYSARRYLSRLTRSFDDSFLEKLTSQGFVQEKTIYQPNAINPSLRTRINDDLSALPPPYRILRQMLLAPGLLSGFSFAKTGTELEEIDEEEDPDALTQKFSSLAIVDKEQKRSITYERLPREKKEDVLADLLVKSAINDALDKQMRVLEEQALREKYTYDEKETISEFREEEGETFDKESTPIKRPPVRSKPDGASSAKSNYSQFDMGEAVMNYLESQLEVQSVKSATGSNSSGPKGSKVSMKSPRFKNTGQLSPIRSVDETGLQSREQTFASAAALPPITKHIIDLSLPLVQVEPPTPQSSTLTQASIRPTAVSREPTLEVTKEAEDETTDEEEIKVTPSSSLHTVELTGQFEDPGSTALSSSFSSSFHKHKTGNPAGWRVKDTVESKMAQKRKKKKGAEEKSTTGSVIVVPGGETVSVGGTIRPITPVKLNASTDDGEKWTRPPSPTSLVSGQQINSSMEKVELTERSDDLSPSGASLLSVKLPQGDGSENYAFSPKPMSEHELVSALTEHAQKIASTILSRPGTGVNLENDAKKLISQFLMTKRDEAKSAGPTAGEYKQLLKETLAGVLSKMSDSELPPDFDLSDELIEQLTKDEVHPEDLEIITDDEGKSIISSKRVQSARESEKSKRTPKPSGQIGIRGSRVEDQKQPMAPRSTGAAAALANAVKQGEAAGLDERKAAAAAVRKISTVQQPSLDKLQPDDGSRAGDSVESEVSVRGQSGTGEQSKGLSPSAKTSKTSKAASVASSKSAMSNKSALSNKSQKIDRSKGSKTSQRKDSIKSTSDANGEKERKLSSGIALEDREEFVVPGKIDEKKELSQLYGQTEEEKKEAAVIASKKPKKAIPDAAKPSKKSSKKKSHGKKGKKSKKEEKAEKLEGERVSSSRRMESADSRNQQGFSSVTSLKSADAGRSSGAKSSQMISSTPATEERKSVDIEFDIIRDEFSPSDEEKTLSPDKPVSTLDNYQYDDRSEEETMDDEESEKFRKLTNKEARAAKRAAQAEKRRQEVERKRREREEAARKAKEEDDRREQMRYELEEERRRREEERRLRKLKDEEERRREEEEELAAVERARVMAEREKRMKEEHARKLEDMRKKKEEEDRLKREQAERDRLEEEYRRKAEEEMLAKMAAEEREEYERKKREEEERKRLEQEEAERRRLEEEKKALEEQLRLAAELARRQAELEARLQFNRSMKLESLGLGRMHKMNRAFVWSYFQLLRMLGIPVSEEEIKRWFR